MDYFFAQAEEKRHPEYIGKIVVVCVYSKKTGDAGVVSTVNYEGRKRGIHSGQPIFQAKRKAPLDAVFIPVDHGYYSLVSADIGKIIEKFGDAHQTSIDEWFIETKNMAEATARAAKQEVKAKIGITCSVGVAPSLLGAKMAADRCKPDGLLALDEENERKLIDDSDVDKIIGIGKKSAETLNNLSVFRVNDLKRIDPVLLVERFGKKTGSWLVALAEGRYHGLLMQEHDEQGEVSRIGTLENKTRDPSILLEKVTELEKDAKRWLRENNKFFRTLIITFVTEDMAAHSKSISFRKPRGWSDDNSAEERMLISQFLDESSLEIRRIGMKYFNFLDVSGQKTLADEFCNLLYF